MKTMKIRHSYAVLMEDVIEIEVPDETDAEDAIDLYEQGYSVASGLITPTPDVLAATIITENRFCADLGDFSEYEVIA